VGVAVVELQVVVVLVGILKALLLSLLVLTVLLLVLEVLRVPLESEEMEEVALIPHFLLSLHEAVVAVVALIVELVCPEALVVALDVIST
jgi:hypothetical protein